MEENPELGMSELDKFKRRLIRSVAWMLIQQKMPESAVWAEMKKVMGCDCLQLWEHMRSLTQKKLKRLLAAEDRMLCIPEVARMSLTDWLLYDQVLVHENIDVIGLANMSPYKADSKPLIDLFALVQRFDIESKIGDDLADAWTAATVYYNSQGHQCSPMLLQKRWFQLKIETRRRFYEFWHSYRGSEKQIPKAEQYRPTILQRTLAKRFPEVITHKFPDWEAAIKDELIVLPKEFEIRKHVKVLPESFDENSPDIVVLEPDVETIDLLHESDSEQENNQDETTETNSDRDSPPVTIKVEPEDPVLDISSTIEKPKKTDIAMAQVVEEEMLFDNINDDIVEMAAEEQNLMTIASNFESKMREAENAISAQDIENGEHLIPKITNVFGNVVMTDETLSIIGNISKDCVDTDNTDNNSKQAENSAPGNTEDTQTQSEKELFTGGPVCLRIDIVDSSEESDIETDHDVGNKQIPIKETVLNDTSLSTVSEVAPNMEPFVLDDTEKAVLSKITDVHVSFAKHQSSINGGAELQKLQLGNIDLSSFGDIPEDLNFADDGIELVDDGVADIDQSINEVDKGGSQVEVNSTESTSTSADSDSSQCEEVKLDEKLFLDPVVYTQKLDDMGILKNKNIDTINVKAMLNKIIDESKPISDRSVDAHKARIEKQRISLSSYMLQKPKNRKYNPIQLCKNPDFNTRLKRITAGFLSSWQNRTLLKACKPLTIDLTKTFESKLIDNTIYLKKPDSNSVIEIDKSDEKTSSVMPSVIPIHTLIDNTRLDDVLKLTDRCSSYDSEGEDILVERNKIIHLPDITQVRRINQSLLTAEVSPIQIQTTSKVSQSTVHTKHVQTNALQKNNVSEISAKNDNLNVNKTVANQEEVTIGSTGHVNYNLSLKSSILAKLLKTPAQDPILHKNKNTECNQNEQSDSSSIPPPASVEIQNRYRLQKKPERISWRPINPSRFRSSWTERTKFPEVKHDEFLLTMDTLHKLLHLFSGQNKENTSGKKKKEKKPIKKRSSRKDPEQKIPKAKRTKPTNEAKKAPKSTVTKAHKTPYCCWARERILYIQLLDSCKRKSKHTCKSDNCTCCCKIELEELISEKSEMFEPEPIDSTEISWLEQPNVLEKCATETVVTDNTPLQNSNTLTITNVCSLNSASINQKTLDASNTSVPPDENVELNIPIVDETPMVKFRVYAAKSTKPAKINIEPDKTTHNMSGATQPIINPGEIISAHPDEHLKLNIPIFDETRPNTSNVGFQAATTAATKNCEMNIPICNETQSITPVNSKVNKDEHVIDVTIKISKTPNTSVHALNESGNSSKCVKPCSCQIINVNENKKQNIIINDQHTTQQNEQLKVTPRLIKKDKILILNKKQMKNVPVGCPIFLGTNKLLLTDVPMPSVINEQTSLGSPIPNFSQNATAQPALPRGVHLVLYGNGKLNYTMTPGIELSPEDKAKMPALLETIQRQMNSAGVGPFTTAVTKPGHPSISDEVVDISDDETSPAPEVVNVVNSPLATTSIVQINVTGDSSNDNSKDVEVNIHPTATKETEPNKSTSQTQNDQHTEVSDKLTTEYSRDNLHTRNTVVNIENDNNIESTIITTDINSAINSEIGIEHISQTANNSDVNISNNDKDLSNNIGLEVNEEETQSSKKTILSDLMEMSGISAEDAAPVEVEPAENETITLSDVNNLFASTTATDSMHLQMPCRLNTVSSFAELKYACQRNGQFFKLDVETGNVVPINVCVKKKPRIRTPSEVRIAPKCTIDLTEHVDYTTEDENASALPLVECPSGISISPQPLRNERSLLKVQSSPVKNLKNFTIFRAVQRPRILKRINKSDLPKNLQIIKTSLTDAKDARLVYRPVLQETRELSQRFQQKRQIVEESISLSDSSDEEPLIKKVKRKQAQTDQAQSEQANEVAMVSVRKDLEKSPSTANLSTGPEEEETSLFQGVCNLFEDPPNEQASMEYEEVLLNSSIFEGDENGEEDCILGV